MIAHHGGPRTERRAGSRGVAFAALPPSFGARLFGRALPGYEEGGGSTDPSSPPRPCRHRPPGAATAPSDPLAQLDPDHGRSSTVLEAQELSLSFGTKRILSEVTMPFARGKITALIGPTGSGKSTLLRTFNRMNDRVEGFHHQGEVALERRQPVGAPSRPPRTAPSGRACCSNGPTPFPCPFATMWSLESRFIESPRASSST